MLVLLTILVVSTAFLLFAVTRRRQSLPGLSEPKSPNLTNPETLRPLFQPTDDELRAFERLRLAEEAAKDAESRRQAMKEKADEVAGLTNEFALRPDRRGLVALLGAAAGVESAEVFCAAAFKAVEIFSDGRLEDVTATELADLLDSHFRTLPQQERSAGAVFRLREEIASLRARTEAAA